MRSGGRDDCTRNIDIAHRFECPCDDDEDFDSVVIGLAEAESDLFESLSGSTLFNTSSIGLAQLEPVVLIQLIEIGTAFFTIPEAIFDLDFPGHYFAVSRPSRLTHHPCHVEPYVSVSSTPTLLSSTLGTIRTLSNGDHTHRGDNDPRSTTSNLDAQSIVTSTAQMPLGSSNSLSFPIRVMRGAKTVTFTKIH
jgi:hypothetical protein